MIKIGICDDELEEAERLRKMAGGFFLRKKISCEIEVSCFGENLLKDAGSYQIFLLDIELGAGEDEKPVINGIRLAQKLREKNKRAEIFFITNHEKYRLAAVCAHYFYYLRKPVTRAVFEPLLQEAFEYICQKGRKCGFTLPNGGCAVFEISDILFFKTENKCAAVWTMERSVKINDTLESIAEKLREDFAFASRSCLINLEHVIENNNNTSVVMRNGTVLKIAARRRKGFAEAFLSYLERQL